MVTEVWEEYKREGDNSEWLGSRVQPGVVGLFLEMSLIGWVEPYRMGSGKIILYPQTNQGNQTKSACYPGQSSSGLLDMKTDFRKGRIQEMKSL